MSYRELVGKDGLIYSEVIPPEVYQNHNSLSQIRFDQLPREMFNRSTTDVERRNKKSRLQTYYMKMGFYSSDFSFAVEPGLNITDDAPLKQFDQDYVFAPHLWASQKITHRSTDARLLVVNLDRELAPGVSFVEIGRHVSYRRRGGISYVRVGLEPPDLRDEPRDLYILPECHYVLIERWSNHRQDIDKHVTLSELEIPQFDVRFDPEQICLEIPDLKIGLMVGTRPGNYLQALVNQCFVFPMIATKAGQDLIRLPQ